MMLTLPPCSLTTPATSSLPPQLIFRIMGRSKLQIKKLDDLTDRQIKYGKRKNGIIKKASELSVLCNSDVGVIMFSPTGRLTSFSSGNERVEDVLIRFLRECDQIEGLSIETKEHLMDSLVHLKYEAELVDLLAEYLSHSYNIKCALEKEHEALKDQLTMVQGTLRFYNPALSNITSVRQAEVGERFIKDALKRVRKIKEKFLSNNNSDQEAESIEISKGEIADADPVVEESVDSNPILPTGDQPKEDNLQETAGSSSMGPHLSINFITERSNWNLPGSNKLPFKEIVDHELFNDSPEDQQNMDTASSGVTMGGLIGKPDPGRLNC